MGRGIDPGETTDYSYHYDKLAKDKKTHGVMVLHRQGLEGRKEALEKQVVLIKAGIKADKTPEDGLLNICHKIADVIKLLFASISLMNVKLQAKSLQGSIDKLQKRDQSLKFDDPKINSRGLSSQKITVRNMEIVHGMLPRLQEFVDKHPGITDIDLSKEIRKELLAMGISGEGTWQIHVALLTHITGVTTEPEEELLDDLSFEELRPSSTDSTTKDDEDFTPMEMMRPLSTDSTTEDGEDFRPMDKMRPLSTDSESSDSVDDASMDLEILSPFSTEKRSGGFSKTQIDTLIDLREQLLAYAKSHPDCKVTEMNEEIDRRISGNAEVMGKLGPVIGEEFTSFFKGAFAPSDQSLEDRLKGVDTIFRAFQQQWFD